jgi:hypothetical protein
MRILAVIVLAIIAVLALLAADKEGLFDDF